MNAVPSPCLPQTLGLSQWTFKGFANHRHLDILTPGLEAIRLPTLTATDLSSTCWMLALRVVHMLKPSHESDYTASQQMLEGSWAFFSSPFIFFSQGNGTKFEGFKYHWDTDDFLNYKFGHDLSPELRSVDSTAFLDFFFFFDVL